MRMYLKSALKVADDKHDDTEDDPALHGTMTMRSRSLAELTQLIERAATYRTARMIALAARGFAAVPQSKGANHLYQPCRLLSKGLCGRS